MGRNVFLGERNLVKNLDEIGDLIKQSKVLTAAVKKNPALAFSLANAAQKVAGETELSDKMFATIIKSDANLLLAAKDPAFRTDFRKFLEAVIKLHIKTAPETPTDTGTDGGDDGEEAPETVTEEKPVSELNLKILELINEIPYAHPGDIITSEHHNSLRRAIKALAALVDDVDTTTIHTFAPNFLPIAIHKPEGDKEQDWTLLFDSAVVEGLGSPGGAGSIVRGGVFVRLPDDALIKSMVLRGKRIQDDADDPKSFNVTLFRIEPDKSKPKAVPLINFDLTETNGPFKKTASPDTSVRVDNAKYMYFVLAVWEDEDDSAGYEIRPFQIICER